MGRIVQGLLARQLRISILVTSIVTATLVWSAPADEETETFVSIGTGELNGLYYPVAEALCHVAWRELRAQGIWCSPETTPGSVYNVSRIQSGELEFGIIQSDVQYAAFEGTGAWNGRPVSDLRSVLSLYPELVTVIARADADIHVLADLAGKRVNVGSQGTGTRATWEAIAAEIDQTRPVKLMDLRTSETTAALCQGSIDANLLIVGHPSPLVSKELASCPSNFVAVSGSAVDKLLSADLFYARGDIPTDLYGIAAKVPSFGSRATLVTSASADPRVVAAIARAIVTHIADLRAAHPALAHLKAEEMVSQSLTAPLHPAAQQVYRSLGLIK
jgi:uncharacterized protein